MLAARLVAPRGDGQARSIQSRDCFLDFDQDDQD